MVRCEGENKKGKQCGSNALPGSKYCRDHQDQDKEKGLRSNLLPTFRTLLHRIENLGLVFQWFCQVNYQVVEKWFAGALKYGKPILSIILTIILAPLRFFRRHKLITALASSHLIVGIALWAGLAQDIGVPVWNWACKSVPIHIPFCPIEEVESLPHLSFGYQSNYPTKYFRVTQNVDLSKPLESILYITNESKYTLENFSANIYILRGDLEIERFLKIYNLNDSEYIKIGTYPYSFVKNGTTIPIDIIYALRRFFKNNENLMRFLLPEPRKPQALLKILKKLDKSDSTENLFTKEGSILNTTFVQWDLFSSVGPSKESKFTGEKLPHKFNGAILKIIVEYDAGEYRFKHLLAGGMYYMYIVDSNKEIPSEGVTSGFMKADYSLWARKSGESFALISSRQNVVDLNKEGKFRPHGGGPFVPGEEIILRLAPGFITLKQGEFIPIPFYSKVENNLGKP